ncbi:MAG: CvpA family protein [Firmicutes bacterium]|nr:CvpA family protein [Bacillota bacterium]
MTEFINKADIAVILMLLAAMIYGWQVGIVKNAVGLASKIISYIAARAAVPYVAIMVRATPIFDIVRDNVKEKLGLDTVMRETTQRAQADLINSLSLPDMLKTSLLENNNNEIYDMLGVEGISDYISGYLANIIINAGIMLIIMVILWTVIPIICKSLISIAELPIVKTADKTFGTIFGFFQATFIIWIVMAVIFVMNMGGESEDVIKEIEESNVAVMFYESNIIKDILMSLL